MTELRRTYEKPTLVMIGDKPTLSRGLWNHDAMAGYIIAHGRDKWIDVGELARIVWRHNRETSRHEVRKRLPALKRVMATNHNHLLVVEYNGFRNAATAVKLYDATRETDQQAMRRMIEKMDERRDRMAEYYRKVTGLVWADDHVANEGQ